MKEQKELLEKTVDVLQNDIAENMQDESGTVYPGADTRETIVETLFIGGCF